MPPEPSRNSSGDRPNPWGKAADESIEAVVTGTTATRTVLPSDSDSAPAAEQFNCPNCGGTIKIKAAGYSVSIACQYCGSMLDVSNPDVSIIQRYEGEVRKLELPLGRRGELRGTEWEVIGYQQRSENGQYPWDEYLLFNPYKGYAFLNTDGRGWSMSRQLTAAPEKKSLVGFEVDGEFYEPFYAQARARVDYVLGEFYWRVHVGEEALTASFVRQGSMLTWERGEKETVWTLSKLLEPYEITDAFGIEPPRGGGCLCRTSRRPTSKRPGNS